jgi:8-oxo-dGTP diphosphatase
LNIAPSGSASAWSNLGHDIDSVLAFLVHRNIGLPMKRVVAALIMKDGKVLVCQRTRHQTMPLKWEFPGGKIEEGEQPRDALRRELDEELGIDAKIGEEVARIHHQYKSGNSVELRFYVVHQFKGEIENRIFREVRWSSRSELPSYDFLEADLTLVRDLAKGNIL